MHSMYIKMKRILWFKWVGFYLAHLHIKNQLKLQEMVFDRKMALQQWN